MEQTLLERCLAEGRSDLLDQWHPEKNMDVTPELVSSCSHKRAWWRCEKGHVWQARINSRFHGVGCPVCANKVILVGDNDLGFTHPHISEQWHPVKNGDLTPQMVFAGSRRKVWWRCGSGHEWQASILSRTAGSGCPVCSNKKIVSGVNDLASAYPELGKQWLSEKNNPLQADEVSVYSNRRVWWQCELGHQWQAVIARRTGYGNGCPYCTGKKVLTGFNDLATRLPEIAKEWHPTLNGELTPGQVTNGSRKRVWWQCADGHIWKAMVYSRTGTRKTGCPVCAGKVKIRTEL